MEIQKGYVVDGKVFESKAAAEEYINRPKVEAALNQLNSNNKELTAWLLDNQETVIGAFDVGTLRRVKKTERNQLEKALARAKELDDSKMTFLVENADVILESFRWPTVRRLADEEKTVAIKNTLSAAADGNKDLVEWVIENKEEILDAYKAAKPKREVTPAAANGLALYREGQAIRKAHGDEAGDEFKDAVKANDMAKMAALRSKYPV